MAGIAGGEVGFGESQTKVDGVFPEAASVRQEDTGLSFGYGLGIIAEVALEFAGGIETAELEFDGARAVGEGAGVLQVLGSLGGIFE